MTIFQAILLSKCLTYSLIKLRKINSSEFILCMEIRICGLILCKVSFITLLSECINDALVTVHKCHVRGRGLEFRRRTPSDCNDQPQ